MKRLSIIIIAGLGILVYSNTFFCSFQFDDDGGIVNNFAIRNIQDLPNIWSFNPTRFLNFFSFAFNYHLHKLNLLGYHLFNLSIHVVAAILVWWLVLLTLSSPVMKKDKVARHADLIALVAGLVFVLHPLQTQAVTYISQRATSQAALFYLASLCFYAKSRLLCHSAEIASLPAVAYNDMKFYYTCSLIAAVAAMFTKENTITLPLTVLFYEFTFFRIPKNFNWKYPLPFLFTLCIIPLTMLLTKSVNFQEMHRTSEGPIGILPMHYFLTQLAVKVTYLRLLFLPVNQNLDYDYHISKSIFELPVFISSLFLIAILFIAQRLFSNYRLVSFSIFWFFLTLLPESGFIPINDVIFEHRLYLPLVGYSMFFASSMFYLFENSSFKTMVMVLGAAMIVFYSALTYQRNDVWRDEFSLWDDAVRKSSQKARPYNNRGRAYYLRGDLTQAVSDFNKAITIDPNFPNAYDNLGLVYAGKGNFATAIIYYNKALKLKPTAKAYTNRSVAEAKTGNFTQAIADCHKAIGLDPNFAGAFYNLGHFYVSQGHFAKALFNYSKAIEINPDYAEAYNSRGYTYRRQGNLTQALSDFNKAIEINPDFTAAFYNRGLVYDAQNALARALEDYNKALEIDPKFMDVYYDRAFAYYRLKKYDKAWADVRKSEKSPSAVDAELIKALKKRLLMVK